MGSQRIPVWLDCDPGHDDAFAILLAAYHPRIELLGVSTVFGNASLEDTTRNTASLLTAIGKHTTIPLHVGAGKALARPAIHAPTDIHGESGLDGTHLLPEPGCTPSAVPAVDAMAAALEAQPPGTAWIVATGALTNVGTLLRQRPAIAAHLAGLSLMGGSIGGGFSDVPMGTVDGRPRIGNVTPFAEFNIFIDPEAAAEVFGNAELAGKTTMVPLDLTHQALATPEVMSLLLHGHDADRTGPGKSRLRKMLVELLAFFGKTYTEVFSIEAGPPLHDPLAVAVILADVEDGIPFSEWDAAKSNPPQHKERFQVTVITEGTLDEGRQGKETGRTLVKELPQGEAGVRIPRSVDVDRFWHVLEECLQRADEVNGKLGK